MIKKQRKLLRLALAEGNFKTNEDGTITIPDGPSTLRGGKTGAGPGQTHGVMN